MTRHITTDWVRRLTPEDMNNGAVIDYICALAEERTALSSERDEARALAEEACAKHNALLEDRRILRCTVCPKHPMREVEASRAALVEALEKVAAGEVLDEFDGHGVGYGPSESAVAVTQSAQAIARAALAREAKL